MDLVQCECGCGQSFPKYDNRNRIRRFISGHNSRGKTKQRVILNCDFCGKKIERLQCQLKYEHHFCSDHCRALWVGMTVTQTVEYKDKKRQIALNNGSKPPILKGENHPNWKGGVTPINQIARSGGEYCKWRKAVLAKDNYTCQICGIRGGHLSAHHIKDWALFPELRYDVENGQCLHYDCHMELHGLNKKTA